LKAVASSELIEDTRLLDHRRACKLPPKVSSLIAFYRSKLSVTLIYSAPLTSEEGEQTMSDIKDKLKDKIDDAADATKKAVDVVAEKSKDAAHKAGKQLEQGGKRLQKT
jgi:hypothetical protein